MKKNIRVALSFATTTDSQLNNFAILVLVCLKNNPLFPGLPVTLTALETLQTAYQNALTAAANGGRLATAAKKEARVRLITALRQIAAYVQSVGLTNVSDVLSSGFDIISHNSSSVPLVQPVLTGLDNSVSGQLQVYLQAVKNASAYQVQYAIGDGPWLEAGIFRSTRNVIITGLTAGTVYAVRVRAVGVPNVTVRGARLSRSCVLEWITVGPPPFLHCAAMEKGLGVKGRSKSDGNKK